MIKEYNKECNLTDLTKEISTIIPNKLNECLFIVEGDKTKTVITLPDNINIILIDNLVKNHINKPAIQLPDWNGLEEALRSSKPFIRVYMECKSKSEITPIYSLMMDCITSSGNLATLGFALADLNNSVSGGFSEEEITIINNALSLNYFPLNLSTTELTNKRFIAPPNWEGLEKSLSASAVFYKVYQTAKTSTTINCIFTLLQDCITSFRNISTLQFVLNDLKISLLPAFSTVEIDFINQLLINNNFLFTI